MMHDTHCAPLERGNLDMSHSINMSIFWIGERDSDQKVLLAERIIPTGIMACYQVTLSSNTPHGAPLERGNLDMSHSINISILWIEERDSDQKVLLAERIIPTGIMARSQVTLSSNTPHGTPLECGNLDMSHPINISILWIEERDSDQKVLLAE